MIRRTRVRSRGSGARAIAAGLLACAGTLVATAAESTPLPEPDAVYHGTIAPDAGSGPFVVELRRDTEVLDQDVLAAQGDTFVLRAKLERPVAPQAARTSGTARVGDQIVFYVDDVEQTGRTIMNRGEIVAIDLSETPTCGTPVSGNTGGPTASDALFVLRAAVGLDVCTPACSCDVDGSGSTAASDALLVLSAAVGLSVTLDCAGCP